MQYMLLVYQDENALNETERNECYRESTALTHELNASGHYLAAAPLHPTSKASTVRVREGKRLVTDGPFAETREYLGGYYILDLPDLDAAIEWAARCPGARAWRIEVRPIQEFGLS